MELLHEEIDFSNVQIDPAPFQLVEQTSLYKVIIFSLYFSFFFLLLFSFFFLPLFAPLCFLAGVIFTHLHISLSFAVFFLKLEIVMSKEIFLSLLYSFWNMIFPAGLLRVLSASSACSMCVLCVSYKLTEWYPAMKAQTN